MNKNSALMVAGLVFFIVAVAHFVRIFFGIQIIIAGYILSSVAKLFRFCSNISFINLDVCFLQDEVSA